MKLGNKQKNYQASLRENLFVGVLYFNAFLVFSSVFFIAIMIFFEARDYQKAGSLSEIIFGMTWKPVSDPPTFGILPFVMGSFIVTFFSLLIAAPLGIMTATFLAEISPKSLAHGLNIIIELLAGIPSVVYGFFGSLFVTHMIKQLFPFEGNTGFSLLAAIIILSIMLLPTVISISHASLKAVPRAYYNASLALGSTRWQTIWRIMIPAARSGLITAVILAMGRALGETMAVLMVSGGSPLLPTSFFSPFRTMTSTISMDMSYASGTHRTVLFLIASLLLLFSLLVIASQKILSRHIARHAGDN